MSSNSPKEYWNYINSLNGKKKNNISVDENVFLNFFKDLNANIDYDEEPFVEFPNVTLDNNLDIVISESEIRKAIKKLKTGKSSGIDGVTNEYIKSSSDIMLPVYCKLFNYILDTGIIPEACSLGTIVPIYKGKGDMQKPEYYRPITILSCIGKLFTSVINDRLTSFLENNALLLQTQAGFRKNHSTLDNIFL